MAKPNNDRSDLVIGYSRIFYVVGYFLAVIVASFICAVLLFLGDIDPNKMDFETSISSVFNTAFSGSFITAATAWPGFILTLLISNELDNRSLPFFILFGIVTAFFAVFFAALIFGKGIFFLLHSPGIYVGGAAGGASYAVFARWVFRKI